MNKKIFFPKTVDCKSIIVIDFAKDKSYKSWEAKEALMLSTVIQGLVNRESNEKIYFVNCPNEHFWNPCPADLQQLETEGFFNVPHRWAELDNSKKYPALSYLLKNYYSYVKGKVLCPSLNEKVCDGAIMAAITVCGQRNTIPVTPAMEEYLKAEGKTFEKLEDVRELKTNIEALEWSLENYFDENTTRQFVGQHSWTAFGGAVEDQFPNIYDYYVANKAFVFCLNGNIEEEKNKITGILNKNNYSAPTPVIGLPVDEGKGLETIENLGYYFIISNVQNMSCTSAFELHKDELKKQPEPKAHDVEENDVFVSFYVTDGDSMAFTTLFHYDEVRNRIKDYNIPIGWSVNPLLFDLFPSLMKCRWNFNPNNYEMIIDLNDMTWKNWDTGELRSVLRESNKEAFKKYCDITNYYIQNFDFYTTNNFEGSDEYLHMVKPFFNIKTYQGSYGSPTQIERVGESISSTLTGMTGARDSVAMAFDVRSAVEKFEKGKPAFVLLCVGDGRADYGGGDLGKKLSELIKELKENSDGRNYKFVLPKDLAATWKKWNKEHM